MATNASDEKENLLEHAQQNGSPELKESVQNHAGSHGTKAVPNSTLELSSQARDLTSHTLDWISNASNESLGACLLGLCAITYMILGRVGLVVIGIFGGVVLHATWEDAARDHTNDEAKELDVKRKREKSLDIVKRVLDWRGRAPDDNETVQEGVEEVDFAGFRPETRTALEGLVDTIIKDYVK